MVMVELSSAESSDVPEVRDCSGRNEHRDAVYISVGEERTKRIEILELFHPPPRVL